MADADHVAGARHRPVVGPVNVRYRDIMHTLPFVIQVWMYATPIVYPLSMVPALAGAL